MSRPPSKVSTHENTGFSFNILLHILFLFTVLALFFGIYVSKLERETFESEIEHELNKNLLTSLQQNDTNGHLKEILKTVPFDSLKQMYSQADPAVKTYNTWMVRTMLFTIGAIAVVILIATLFLYFTCKISIPFTSILRDLIIAFIAIAIFEAIFFVYVESKYIPVAPSLLVDRVFSDLRNSI